MHRSVPKSPCPACGRAKDADCAWAHDIIFCHQGSSHGVGNLKLGDVIKANGTEWALTSRKGGFDGAAAVFRPHRPKSPHHRVYSPQEPGTVRATAAAGRKALLAFYAAHDRAWAIPDFHSLTPDELREATLTITKARDRATVLGRMAPQLWREYPDLAEQHRARFEGYRRSIQAQWDDLFHFRTYYLGEVI